MTGRPDISSISNAQTFVDWYWLKAELIEHCRAVGLSPTGSKADLTDRIARFIATGERQGPSPRPAPSSAFDWATEPLSTTTVITDSYRNGPNARAFFVDAIGPHFSFNIEFMEWMKQHAGSTLGDAVEAWEMIAARRLAGERAAIPSSNQFNRYVQDFFDANPDRSMADARTCWAVKRNQPGHNRYQPDDLNALG